MVKALKSILFLFIVASSTNAQDWNLKDVDVINSFDALEQRFVLKDGGIHVINFWATWCKPCVAELPYFEEALLATEKDKIKFTYVSLDLEKHLDSKVIPFLNESNIQAEVILLTDGKYNSWIDRVDPSWSGAIPITLITQGTKKVFFEGSVHSAQEIIDLIKKVNI